MNSDGKNDRVRQAWEEFLNPDVLRTRLIRCSIFITVFESLKDSLITRIRDFYCIGFDKDGLTTHPDYKREVLARNKSKLYASLSWMIERKAIDQSDINVFDRIKACRNKIAHELLEIVASARMPSDFDNCFQDMIDFLNKIEVWWIKNVEIPCNPDFDEVEVSDEEIVPGSMLILSMMQQIALGDESASRSFYEEFKQTAGTLNNP